MPYERYICSGKCCPHPIQLLKRAGSSNPLPEIGCGDGTAQWVRIEEDA